MLNRSEGLIVEELGLEQTEEILDHTVIITIALPGHALSDAILLERPLISFHLVVPALVGVEHQGADLVFFGKLVSACPSPAGSRGFSIRNSSRSHCCKIQDGGQIKASAPSLRIA